MTLADFFLAVNALGIRLENFGGQLQLRCPVSAITPEIKAGAEEHKAAILAMLPSTPVTHPANRESAKKTGDKPSVPETAVGSVATKSAEAIEDQDEECAFEVGYRHVHVWRDWRLEWLLEMGQLCLRMRG